VKFALFLIPVALIGGWIYLIKFAQARAMDQSAEGEEFRTSRPPTWRIVLYTLIFLAIPLYFFYPKLNELSFQLKVLFGFVILIGPAFVIAIGVVLPALVKKKKAWLTKHRTLMLLLLYVVVTLSALLKLWDIFHKQ
jgi:hypothetical protein